MRYDRFVAEVGERASLSREEAEAATHAVLRVLSERLSGGEAEALRAQLPKALQEDLLPPQEEAHDFGVTEFARRVAERTGLGRVPGLHCRCRCALGAPGRRQRV